MNNSISQEPAGIARRLAAIFYDVFLLVAVVLVAASIFTIAAESFGGKHTSSKLLEEDGIKLIFQLYLLFVSGLFYIWFWRNGGQTLGLKVWKIRLVNEHFEPPGYQQCLVRLFFAVVTLLPAGIGLLWMFFNPRRETLYDRLSGTRLVKLSG